MKRTSPGQAASNGTRRQNASMRTNRTPPLTRPLQREPRREGSQIPVPEQQRLHPNQVAPRVRFTRSSPISRETFMSPTLPPTRTSASSSGANVSQTSHSDLAQNQSQTSSFEERAFGQPLGGRATSPPRSQGSRIPRGPSSGINAPPSGLQGSRIPRRQFGQNPSSPSSQPDLVKSSQSDVSKAEEQDSEGQTRPVPATDKPPHRRKVIGHMDLPGEREAAARGIKRTYTVETYKDGNGTNHVHYVGHDAKPEELGHPGMTSHQNRNGLPMWKDEDALNSIMHSNPETEVKELRKPKPRFRVDGRSERSIGRGTPARAREKGQIAKTKAPVPETLMGRPSSRIDQAKVRFRSSVRSELSETHLPVPESGQASSSSVSSSVRTEADSSVREMGHEKQFQVNYLEPIQTLPLSMSSFVLTEPDSTLGDINPRQASSATPSLSVKRPESPMHQEDTDRPTPESSVNYQRGLWSSNLSVVEDAESIRRVSRTSSEMNAEYEKEMQKVEEQPTREQRLRRKVELERGENAEMEKKQQVKRPPSFAQPTAASSSKVAPHVKDSSTLQKPVLPSKGTPSRSSDIDSSKMMPHEAFGQNSLLPGRGSSSALDMTSRVQVPGNRPIIGEQLPSSSTSANASKTLAKSSTQISGLRINEQFRVHKSTTKTAITNNGKQTPKMMKKVKKFFRKKETAQNPRPRSPHSRSPRSRRPSPRRRSPTPPRRSPSPPLSQEALAPQAAVQQPGPDPVEVAINTVAVIDRCLSHPNPSVHNLEDLSRTRLNLIQSLDSVVARRAEHEEARAGTRAAQLTLELAQQGLAAAQEVEERQRLELESSILNLSQLHDELSTSEVGEAIEAMRVQMSKEAEIGPNRSTYKDAKNGPDIPIEGNRSTCKDAKNGPDVSIKGDRSIYKDAKNGLDISIGVFSSPFPTRSQCSYSASTNTVHGTVHSDDGSDTSEPFEHNRNFEYSKSFERKGSRYTIIDEAMKQRLLARMEGKDEDEEEDEEEEEEEEEEIEEEEEEEEEEEDSEPQFFDYSDVNVTAYGVELLECFGMQILDPESVEMRIIRRNKEHLN